MFRKLLSLGEATRAIQRQFKPKPMGSEKVPLLTALNRVLAAEVVAQLDIPPFTRSTVDGYALKAEDTFKADESKPSFLKVHGTVSIGEPPKVVVACGLAAEIVTGAPLPEGADAVVMIEDTERKGKDLRVFAAVAKDENVMQAGSDIHKGESVLKVGQVLGSREIGVMAALGMKEAKVFKVPRVAVLSTGSEVTEPGKRLAAGKIYDINAYSLSAAVEESGGKPIYLGVVPDEPVELSAVLRRGLNLSDLVITSGGVSVGPKDIMPNTVNSLGKPGVIFSGIAVKPGKPTTAALIDDKLVFSLPGHPASALLLFHLLVRPIIQKMAGRNVEGDAEVKAYAAVRMFSAKGRRTFVMVRLNRDKANRLVAEPIADGASGAITTLARADGFLEIGENLQFIDANEEVTVRLFKPGRF